MANAWDWGKDRFYTDDPCLKAVFFQQNNSAPAAKPEFALPRRHSGSFEDELSRLFERYRSALEKAPYPKDLPSRNQVKRLCDGILKAIEYVHLGEPSEAYRVFSEKMDELVPLVPLPYVQDLFDEKDKSSAGSDLPASLCRVRGNTDGHRYSRGEIFHNPANRRDHISTSRYSIAGYPSLYLADSLELCLEEMGHPSHYITSRFLWCSPTGASSVVDLGVRPQDLVGGEDNRKLANDYANHYLFWYPLIAACSFVRANPDGTYSDEYAVPQLLMQWLRVSSRKKPGRGGSRGPFGPTGGGTPRYEEVLDRIRSANSELKEAWKAASHPDTESAGQGPSDEDLARAGEYLQRLLSDLVDELDALRANPDLIGSRDTINALHELLHTTRLLGDAFYGKPRRQGRRRRTSPEVTSMAHSLASRWRESDAGNRGREPGGTQDPLRTIIARINTIADWLFWFDRSNTLGIRYFSCKDLHAPELGRNYVFPTEDLVLDSSGTFVKDASKRMYCKQLNALFRWTEPEHREDFGTAEELIRALGRDREDNLHP